MQTGDTGQINLTTVTRPLAANTSMGYQIWRMADTLQSTKPVFVKIEYGSSAATNRPGLWFHIGTGSDGAGNITGRVWDSRENSANAVMGNALDSATSDTVYYWGNTGAVVVCMFGAGIGPNYVRAVVDHPGDCANPHKPG